MTRAVHAESVSVQEAADRLSVSPTTIRRLIMAGDFPHAFRVRTCIRIPLSDLDTFERKARVLHVER